MKSFLARLFKILAYGVAGLVILLAIGVGMLRLLLPRLPEYQEQIKGWASEAIGVEVDFTSMDARWGLDGPELNFFNAELIRPDSGKRIVAADEVSISVALIRLVAERTVAIDQVIVRDSQIEIRQLEDGSFRIQGDAIDQLLPQQSGRQAGRIELVAENIDLQFLQPGDERPSLFRVSRAVVRSDEQRISIAASIEPPESVADDVTMSATYLLSDEAAERAWDFSVRLEEASLPGLTAFAPAETWAVASGVGDLDVSLRWNRDAVQSAAIDVDLDDVSKDGGDPVAVNGLIEYRRDPEGWLVAANELLVETTEGTWPPSSFRIDAGTNEAGAIVMLDARADYLNLRDLPFVYPLLDDNTKELLAGLNPSGEVRDLDMTLSGIGTDAIQYAVSVDLSDFGMDAYQSLPGFRGLSARARADMAGGRIEMRSGDMTVFPFEYLDETLLLERALGTIIWRRSGDRTTVLSDNIALSNADFDSQSNVQVTLDDGQSPVIDLASRWSITDLGSAKRFIPSSIMHPKLHQWFQDALLSGRIEDGRTRLYGALDNFPFDDGEGRFLLRATVQDSLFKYLPQWPAAELVSMDVVLENTRLYTNNNLSINEGREVRDAKVEIADLRNGILTIQGASDGELQSLLDFSRNSPINRLLGGQLDRISVSGSASTDVDLNIPLKRSRDFTMRIAVEASDAELKIDGLNPPIENVNGKVIIRKDRVTSEQLRGRFLGEDIRIDLKPATDAEPGYRLRAEVTGSAAAEQIVSAFELPIGDLLSGRSDYEAEILFPKANGEAGEPFAIRISSNLDGFGVALPPPFGKPEDSRRRMRGDIRFLPDAAGIATRGQSEGFGWEALFVDTDGFDFERGSLAIGDSIEPVDAETRGLHITGNIERFHLAEWMALSGDADAGTNVVDRIRSVDVRVGEIRLLGQRLEDHAVTMDRGARSWLMRIDGEQVAGEISLPYEFSADTTLEMDMQRLILPGDGEDDSGDARTDPRGLPSIRVKAEEFALGSRFFGRVEAEIVRTADGLVADQLLATDGSFEVFANGRWVANPVDPLGFTTYVTGGLKSRDIKATMQRLDYQPGLNGDEMSILYDVSWSGAPRADFLDTLSGEVQVAFGPGQLDDIEPGAGRVFGLLSIVALPRRLSLDFRDVFQKGFGFDKIDGEFRIDRGDAYTCNLSLEGPAAAIGIVGRTGLDSRDYEQSAIVSANFGNSLPIVGGLVAGPQAAAALLIFSQIFKKPLQDLSQVYYDIDGAWDNPDIENSDAASFAETGKMAGCIQDIE